MSAFGKAFDSLPFRTQLGILDQLRTRKSKYIAAMKEQYCLMTRVVILADTPGPGRPSDPNFHHTPFYSTKHSSLWINQQLVEARIPEDYLLWFNTTLADGMSLRHRHIVNLCRLTDPFFICLGGNAERWLNKMQPCPKYTTVFHPAYAKRFKAGQEYDLVPILKDMLGVKECGTISLPHQEETHV